MKKTLPKTMMLAGLASLMLSSHLSQAQPPQRGGRGGDDRGGMRPRRDGAKGRLGALWNGMWRLEGSAVPLSKAQAKRVVNLVRPWSNQPSMTESQAKNFVTNLNAVLTAAQRNVVGDLSDAGPPGRDGFGPPHGRPGDGPPRGRPGDGPPPPRPNGPDGAQGNAMRSLMERLNPFYPPTGYKEFKTMPLRMRQGLVRRYQESRATLVTLSRKAA